MIAVGDLVRQDISIDRDHCEISGVYFLDGDWRSDMAASEEDYDAGMRVVLCGLEGSLEHLISITSILVGGRFLVVMPAVIRGRLRVHTCFRRKFFVLDNIASMSIDHDGSKFEIPVTNRESGA